MTGKDIIMIFSQNGTALASTCIRSDEIQTQAATIEKASATQQDWREYIAGRKEWSVSVSYLVLTAQKITDVLMVGNVFDVTIRDASSTVSMTGQAILTDCKQSYAVGALAKGSFAFKGSGPLALPSS